MGNAFQCRRRPFYGNYARKSLAGFRARIREVNLCKNNIEGASIATVFFKLFHF